MFVNFELTHVTKHSLLMRNQILELRFLSLHNQKNTNNTYSHTIIPHFVRTNCIKFPCIELETNDNCDTFINRFQSSPSYPQLIFLETTAFKLTKELYTIPDVKFHCDSKLRV